MDSRSSTRVRGTMSRLMNMAAMASARSNDVVAMTTALTITATEPSASLRTSRNAARMLRLSVRPPASTTMATTLPARPTTPNTSRPPAGTSGGAESRRMPSMRAYTPTAKSTSACAAAASTSARR
nr:hypothetical protein DA06_10850 [Georgenia sp. SUBG003]